MSVRSCIGRPIGGGGGLRFWQVLEFRLAYAVVVTVWGGSVGQEEAN